jgi:hypothetical protein
VFGYSHSRDVAEAAGCPSAAPLGGDGAGHAWHHACVACWRSSADGSRVRSGASASFGYRAADALGGDAGRFVPTADDLERFVVESAAAVVQGSAAAAAAAVAAAAGGQVEL